MGEAVEPLFAPTPVPPNTPACVGCIASVSVKDVTWDGTGTPKANESFSMYDFHLKGKCALKQQLLEAASLA